MSGPRNGRPPRNPRGSDPSGEMGQPAEDAHLDEDAQPMQPKAQAPEQLSLDESVPAELITPAGLIDPHGEVTDVIDDVPEMSLADVERRIGARERSRSGRRAAAPVQRVRPVPGNRRMILWRDSATILIGVVLALLVFRFVLPTSPSAATSTATPIVSESQVAIGSEPAVTGIQFSAAPTIGGIVNPSIDLRATPTLPPLITLPPATPRPTASPTTAPGSTPKPTPKPTPRPTTSATPTPPHATFTFSCTGTAMAHFVATATAGSAGGPILYEWNFDDGSTGTTNPIDHTFLTAGPWNVFVKVTDKSGLFYVTPTQMVNC